jgi:hypothetical protein
MPRFRYIICFALVLCLALPAVGSAALPVKGSFLNDSNRNGTYLTTTRHTIRSLQFFCKQTRYDVIDLVHVRKNGTFSYRGRTDRYGPGGELMGTTYKVRLSGRFTSPKRVRIKRTLAGCGTATVSAPGRRG